MKVVLLGEIKGKGGEGDVIDVAQGYAENYLIPQKLAVAATKGNLKQLEERRNNIEKREAVRLADANALKAKLDGQKVAVDAKVGEEGVLFGSVTAAMIVDAIKAELDVEIDRKRVELGKPIKVAGSHEVEISIYREIKASIVVLVGVEEQAEETVELRRSPLRRPPRSRPRLLPSSLLASSYATHEPRAIRRGAFLWESSATVLGACW